MQRICPAQFDLCETVRQLTLGSLERSILSTPCYGELLSFTHVVLSICRIKYDVKVVFCFLYNNTSTIYHIVTHKVENRNGHHNKYSLSPHYFIIVLDNVGNAFAIDATLSIISIHDKETLRIEENLKGFPSSSEQELARVRNFPRLLMRDSVD